VGKQLHPGARPKVLRGLPTRYAIRETAWALWEARTVRSIANLTRRDGEEFFALAPKAGIRTEVATFPLSAANEALDRLRAGRVRGAAVLVMG